MKRSLILIAAALLTLSLSMAASAQEPSITARIPFDFYVGNTRIPAGVYVIESPRSGLQVIRDKNTNLSVASVATIPLTTAETLARGALVFNCYGDDRFLSQVLWGGTSFGRAIVKRGMEAELARNNPHANAMRVVTGQQ